MRADPLRRLIGGLFALLTACAIEPLDPLEGPADPVDAAHAFVDDPQVRRDALEASVAVADTPYARLRLAHYGRDWDALPVFAPRVRALGAPDDEGEIVRDAWDRSSLDEWERAGAEAFERYPAQMDLGLAALRDPIEAARAGFVVRDGRVHGVVEVETQSGWVVALTCAACHAAERSGSMIAGLANDRLDLGTLLDPRWPRGTIDVTDDGVLNPVRPSDLRPIAQQARLQHAGNVANGRLARMVRIETLLVTQRGARFRPDRAVVAALALYLESLAPPAPDPAHEGARVFARTCGHCHRGDAMAGPPIGVDLVGTDDAATRAGTERSTGGYRAPSLRGVIDRRGLLHDGSAADLDGLLGLAPSAHRGHPFGRELPERERQLVVGYLGVR